MKKMIPDTITFVDFGADEALIRGSAKDFYTHYCPEVKEGLIEMIRASASGSDLLEYCRELSYDLVKRYMAEDDVQEMMERFCDTLQEGLRCTPQQARCLVNLTLELIHFKVHGDYRRANVDLSYLIAMATAAIRGVGPQ